MKTGGAARYFFCVKNTEEVKEAILFAKEKSLPIFIFGGGSNVIVSDEVFSGVTIKMEIRGIEFKEIGNKTRVIAGAGVEWDRLVERTVNCNLYGLENLSLIPGTVGATPVQNIGAYGVEVKDIIEWVEVMNIETMEIERIINKECLFEYRDSFFKSEEGKKLIILSVAFGLEKDRELKTDYKDIVEYFSRKNIAPTLKTLRKAIIEIRMNKLPDMKKIGTAGSFFKNPVVSEKKVQKLLNIYPDLKYFSVDDGTFKLSSAWLLDKVGDWNGKCIGDACVYEKQALVLINRGNSTAKEILSLAIEMQNDIKEKTGIELEFEINIIKNNFDA